MRRLVFMAAFLLAPAVASAQSPAQQYQFSNGTLVLGAGFTSDGCGTFICLNLRAGAGGDGILVTSTVTRVLPPYVAGNVTMSEYLIRSSVGFVSCPLPPQQFACIPDGGSDYIDSFQLRPSGLNFGVGPTQYGTLNTYSVYLPALVEFTAYDAAGRLVVAERFAPSIVVTPEPATLALTLGGLAVVGVAGAWRRRPLHSDRRTSALLTYLDA